MRIYLDTCCYNRLFDETIQQRVTDEMAAVTSIINRGHLGDHLILGSDVLRLEIENTRDADRKFKLLSNFYQSVGEMIRLNDAIMDYAVKITNESNIKKMDALHLSCAKFGGAEAFLTTDDKLIRGCRKLNFSIKVCNPVSYLAEVIGNAEHRCE